MASSSRENLQARREPTRTKHVGFLVMIHDFLAVASDTWSYNALSNAELLGPQDSYVA